MKILSDYEEIFKLFEFSQDENSTIPYQNTHERLRRNLEQQYIENLDEKLNRWLSITKVPYFQDVIPVRFYIQAKMLYREGFYEAAITVSRGICEMICHNLLNKIAHPFGTQEEIENVNFRTLIRFIATPKLIERKVFENDLVDKINEPNERNFVKCCYQFVKPQNSYHFKVENGKKAENTNRLFEIFDKINFEQKDFFSVEAYDKINEIYDLGNIYVHAKKNSGDTKNDAFNMVDGIGFVLFSLYKAEVTEGSELISAYSFFPDICSGVTYWMESSLDSSEVMRHYLNLPSQEQMNQLSNACGTWEGEWKNKRQRNSKGNLILYVSNDCGHDDVCIHGKFKLNDGEEISNLGIQLFGEYFRITGFKNEEKIIEFDLSFLNENTILGKNLLNQGNALFQKID